MPDSTASNKDAAVHFLQLLVAGRIEEAYALYVDMNGRHHNPFFAGNFAALKQAQLEDHVQFPHKQLTVAHVLGDGDLVAVHALIVPAPGAKGVGIVHLYRFAAGKIVELWDIGQPAPDDSPNEHGML